jgi:hypothetical protein
MDFINPISEEKEGSGDETLSNPDAGERKQVSNLKTATVEESDYVVEALQEWA